MTAVPAPASAASTAREAPLAWAGPVSAEAQAALDEIRARRGSVPPMFQVLAASPALALRVEELSTLLWQCGLDKGWLEAAFLMVARKYRCQTQWDRHLPKALAAGIAVEDARCLERDDPAGLTPALRGFCEPVAQLLAGGDMPAAQRAQLLATIGPAGMAHLCAFLGMATIVAITINLQAAPPVQP